MASRPAELLTLAGYRIDLDPALHLTRTSPGPDGIQQLGEQVTALSDAMTGAGTYRVAASLVNAVTHDFDGILRLHGRFFRAAAEQAMAAHTDNGPDLAQDFNDAADELALIGRRLYHADLSMRFLGPPDPHPQHAPATVSRTNQPARAASTPPSDPGPLRPSR
ncbi:hypothetical protein ACFO3J_24480 [Streptomyces polygonati]|uniref:Uncharacterized protein n=1 Tax=Streptomyces polygonati TaxID=1617087 RepID=A0ABV8HUE5_9ACTN